MANIRDVERLKELLLELGRSRPLRDPLSSGAAMELTGPQLHALMWLGNDGALTMGELARRLCVTEKGVTGVGDRLETQKFCQRVRDTKDRRVVRLQLTARGRRLFEDFRIRFDERLTVLLDALGAEDRAALFRILRGFTDHLLSLSTASKHRDQDTRRMTK